MAQRHQRWLKNIKFQSELFIVLNQSVNNQFLIKALIQEHRKISAGIFLSDSVYDCLSGTKHDWQEKVSTGI